MRIFDGLTFWGFGQRNFIIISFDFTFACPETKFAEKGKWEKMPDLIICFLISNDKQILYWKNKRLVNVEKFYTNI